MSTSEIGLSPEQCLFISLKFICGFIHECIMQLIRLS
jgi:hypothetical protein